MSRIEPLAKGGQAAKVQSASVLVSAGAPLPLAKPVFPRGGLSPDEGIKPEAASRVAAAGPGLVSTETSDTRIVVNEASARIRRLRRGILSSAKLIQGGLQDASERFRVAFVTVTYREGEQWEARDVSDLVKCYREWARRRGISVQYVWVLELTRRGRPHYHLVLWLPRGHTPPLPDKQGWWRKGMTQARWARSPVGYLVKYTSKGWGEGSDIPSGARVWGAGGLSAGLQRLKSWWMAPRWLRELVPYGHHVVRADGWWVDLQARIRYRSPWVLDSFGVTGPWLRWVGWSVDDVEFF